MITFRCAHPRFHSLNEEHHGVEHRSSSSLLLCCACLNSKHIRHIVFSMTRRKHTHRLFKFFETSLAVGDPTLCIIRSICRTPIRSTVKPSMKGRRVTHDMGRLRLWECLRAGMRCVTQRGPSYGWLCQAIWASKQIRRFFPRLSVSQTVGQTVEIEKPSCADRSMPRKIPCKRASHD